jgi:hypothetical protein
VLEQADDGRRDEGRQQVELQPRVAKYAHVVSVHARAYSPGQPRAAMAWPSGDV